MCLHILNVSSAYSEWLVSTVAFLLIIGEQAEECQMLDFRMSRSLFSMFVFESELACYTVCPLAHVIERVLLCWSIFCVCTCAKELHVCLLSVEENL